MRKPKTHNVDGYERREMLSSAKVTVKENIGKLSDTGILQ